MTEQPGPPTEHLDPADPRAAAAVQSVQSGDVATLRDLLSLHPGLATARIGTPRKSRTLLHVATDWPGHFPNGPETVAALVAAGADVDARFVGPHIETPLHWAASSDDVAVLDALLDAGADIEGPGAVLAGGGPLDDAVGFGQWNAARRLVERGARTELRHAAALGLLDRVRTYFEAGTADPPSGPDLTNAFWYACHGGRRNTAQYLLTRGADLNWVGWDDLTPLDAARRAGADPLASWLEQQGARPAAECGAGG
jgi:hypothetical protein